MTITLDGRKNLGQVARLVCDECKEPMLTVEEDEARDPVRGYGKGYIGIPVLPSNYCRCLQPPLIS